MQPSVLSLVDHTHPAATKLLDDAVMRDGLADHRLITEKMPSFPGASSYGRGSGQSTNGGSDTVASLPATLSDKIDPPTLLTLPVKNENPARVEMTWLSAVTGFCPLLSSG